MQGEFGTVLWIVCGVGILIAIGTLFTMGRTWEEVGKGHLLMEGDLRRAPVASSPASIAERDAEIRQMLEARNARLARRGEPQIDIEAEIRRLTAQHAPQIDEGLRAEIRELVIARNARRARTGKPPLDIDAEVAREIEMLSQLEL